MYGMSAKDRLAAFQAKASGETKKPAPIKKPGKVGAKAGAKKSPPKTEEKKEEVTTKVEKVEEKKVETKTEEKKAEKKVEDKKVEEKKADVKKPESKKEPEKKIEEKGASKSTEKKPEEKKSSPQDKDKKPATKVEEKKKDEPKVELKKVEKKEDKKPATKEEKKAEDKKKEEPKPKAGEKKVEEKRPAAKVEEKKVETKKVEEKKKEEPKPKVEDKKVEKKAEDPKDKKPALKVEEKKKEVPKTKQPEKKPELKVDEKKKEVAPAKVEAKKPEAQKMNGVPNKKGGLLTPSYAASGAESDLDLDAELAANIDHASSDIEAITPVLEAQKPKYDKEKKEEKGPQAPTKKDVKPAEAPAKNDAKPAEVQAKKEEKPAQVSAKKEEKPTDAPPKKDAKLEVQVKKEEKPAQAPTDKNGKPAEALANKEEKPAQAPAKKEEKPSQAPIKKEEKPAEAPAKKEEKPAQAPAKEEKPAQAPAKKDEKLAQVPTKPIEAPAKKEEKPTEAPAKKEEKLAATPAKKEEKPAEKQVEAAKKNEIVAKVEEPTPKAIAVAEGEFVDSSEQPKKEAGDEQNAEEKQKEDKPAEVKKPLKKVPSDPFFPRAFEFRPLPESFYDTIFYFSGMGSVIGSAMAQGIYVNEKTAKSALDVDDVEGVKSSLRVPEMKENSVKTARNQAQDLMLELQHLQALLDGVPSFPDAKGVPLGKRAVDQPIYGHLAFQQAPKTQPPRRRSQPTPTSFMSEPSQSHHRIRPKMPGAVPIMPGMPEFKEQTPQSGWFQAPVKKAEAPQKVEEEPLSQQAQQPQQAEVKVMKSAASPSPAKESQKDEVCGMAGVNPAPPPQKVPTPPRELTPPRQTTPPKEPVDKPNEEKAIIPPAPPLPGQSFSPAKRPINDPVSLQASTPSQAQAPSQPAPVPTFAPRPSSWAAPPAAKAGVFKPHKPAPHEYGSFQPEKLADSSPSLVNASPSPLSATTPSRPSPHPELNDSPTYGGARPFGVHTGTVQQDFKPWQDSSMAHKQVRNVTAPKPFGANMQPAPQPQRSEPPTVSSPMAWSPVQSFSAPSPVQNYTVPKPFSKEAPQTAPRLQAPVNAAPRHAVPVNAKPRPPSDNEDEEDQMTSEEWERKHLRKRPIVPRVQAPPAFASKQRSVDASSVKHWQLSHIRALEAKGIIVKPDMDENASHFGTGAPSPPPSMNFAPVQSQNFSRAPTQPNAYPAPKSGAFKPMTFNVHNTYPSTSSAPYCDL